VFSRVESLSSIGSDDDNDYQRNNANQEDTEEEKGQLEAKLGGEKDETPMTPPLPDHQSNQVKIFFFAFIEKLLILILMIHSRSQIIPNKRLSLSTLKKHPWSSLDIQVMSPSIVVTSIPFEQDTAVVISVVQQGKTKLFTVFPN
jgi:hypothetical protein